MPSAELHLTFAPMTDAAARDIVVWRYEAEYALYDLTAEALPVLLEPANGYYAAFDEQGTLVGFCCFGEEARVPGGDYAGPDLLDVGVGLRPDLTGHGFGPRFLSAVLAFACRNSSPRGFRVTVAAFNRRSRRMCERIGFCEVSCFRRESRPSGLAFVIMTREP